MTHHTTTTRTITTAAAAAARDHARAGLGLLHSCAAAVLALVAVAVGTRLPAAARDDRGEIASSVWYMVGLILLAVTVLAVVGAKVQAKLSGI